MPKVWCAAIDCLHNLGNRCHAKEINLRDGTYETVNEGRKRFQQCRALEQDEEIRKLFQELEEYLDAGIRRREEG